MSFKFSLHVFKAQYIILCSKKIMILTNIYKTSTCIDIQMINYVTLCIVLQY